MNPLSLAELAAHVTTCETAHQNAKSAELEARHNLHHAIADLVAAAADKDPVDATPPTAPEAPAPAAPPAA